MTKTGVCNLALRLDGENPITSISQDVERARVLNDVYDAMRDEVLVSHPWNFAIKRDELTEYTTTTPEFQWDTWFTLPGDCLRVIRMEDNDDFAIENRGDTNDTKMLLTNASSAEIKYIAQVTVDAKFPPHFVTCFAARLAAEICFAITGDNTTTSQKWDEYLAKLAQAKSVDAQEGTPDQDDSSNWENARA